MTAQPVTPDAPRPLMPPADSLVAQAIAPADRDETGRAAVARNRTYIQGLIDANDYGTGETGGGKTIDVLADELAARFPLTDATIDFVLRETARMLIVAYVRGHDDGFEGGRDWERDEAAGKARRAAAAA